MPSFCLNPSNLPKASPGGWAPGPVRLRRDLAPPGKTPAQWAPAETTYQVEGCGKTSGPPPAAPQAPEGMEHFPEWTLDAGPKGRQVHSCEASVLTSSLSHGFPPQGRLGPLWPRPQRAPRRCRAARGLPLQGFFVPLTAQLTGPARLHSSPGIDLSPMVTRERTQLWFATESIKKKTNPLTS